MFGVVNHALFAFAIGSMAVALWTGLEIGRGSLHGPTAALVNSALVVQFPLVHSALLGQHGGRWLALALGHRHGRTLVTTSYATAASLQLLATFWLWSPSHLILWQPAGLALWLHAALFGACWIFLVRAIFDSGVSVQSGLLGWWSVFRGQPPRYPSFATRGTFAYCRQPIYLAFALILWTAPDWTVDRIALAGAWTTYCVLGPLLKERRYERRHGDAYRAYQRRVAYFLPFTLRRS
ncbi:MAG: isoprenylcysteine carboxylmethyltransferase family protein [Planctomycetota bacterium]